MSDNEPERKKEIASEKKPEEQTTQSQETLPEENKQEGEDAQAEQKETERIKENPVKLEDLKSGIERPEKGGRVCITYGRDQIMNRQVVALIRELGIDPIVMQDKSNQSKPIAQFYTENPDISFMVAILSADDWVYPKDGKPKDALMYADQRVVFHLGFWIGRLGRSHVFTLYYDQKSFRWPTEHFDIIYTPLDKNGAWKEELVERFKASGIKIAAEKK